MRGRLTAGRLFAGRLFGAQASPDERPEDEPGIQPGAFAPLSRPSSPINRAPFKRRARQRRDQDLLIL